MLSSGGAVGIVLMTGLPAVIGLFMFMLVLFQSALFSFSQVPIGEARRVSAKGDH